MFVKICGTTNLEDALLAADAGADALGFIFAPSKRRVDVATVAGITPQLPPHMLLVGVFTAPEPIEIRRAMHEARLGAVQMHWSYDPAVLDALDDELETAFKYWQVVGFPVGAADETKAERRFRDELRAALRDARIDTVLLDAVKGNASGGLGEAFSWRRAQEMVQPILQEAEAFHRDKGSKMPRLAVAGGLHAENVQEAIEILRPWGVDVVSGVEAGPGKKSPDRLRAFVEVAKADFSTSN